MPMKGRKWWKIKACVRDICFSANILNAVAKLCVVYSEHMSDEAFKEKIGAISVKQLIRIAKERRPGSMGVAEAIILEYNGKKKTSARRLNMSKLYAKDFSELMDEEEDSQEEMEVRDISRIVAI